MKHGNAFGKADVMGLRLSERGTAGGWAAWRSMLGQLGEEAEHRLVCGADIAHVLKACAAEALAAPPPERTDGDLLAVDLGSRPAASVSVISGSLGLILTSCGLLRSSCSRTSGGGECVSTAPEHWRSCAPVFPAVTHSVTKH